MERIDQVESAYIFEDILTFIEHAELSYNPFKFESKDEIAFIIKKACFMDDRFKDKDTNVINALYKEALMRLHKGEYIRVYTTSHLTTVFELTPKGRNTLLSDHSIETKYSDIA